MASLFWIKFEIAKLPMSPILEFLKNKYLSTLFLSSELQSISVYSPLILQSAKFKLSISILSLKIGCRKLKFLWPISFSDMSSSFNRFVPVRAMAKCSRPRLS